jgi:hypothetical protein
MIRKSILVVLLILGTIQLSHAADLDAPAEKKKVTVRSEIERGAAAMGDQLSYLKSNDYEDRIDVVERLLTAEKQKNTDTREWCLGAYFEAWASVSGGYDVAKNFPGKYSPRALDRLYVQSLAYFRQWRPIQKALKIDDDTFISLMQRKPGVKADFYRWDKISAGKP